MVPKTGTAPPDCLAADGEAAFVYGASVGSTSVEKELQRCLFKILRQKEDGQSVAAYLLKNWLSVASSGASPGSAVPWVPDPQECSRLHARIGNASSRIASCGSWLLFGEHKRTGDFKLLAAQFCEQPYLCLFCQARRSYRVLNVYWGRIAAVDGIHLHVTLTIPNTPDLQEGIRSLKTGFRLLWDRAKKKKQGPFRHALGAVMSLEITVGKDGLWHPHIHAVVSLSPESGGYLPYKELREEWCKLTGGRQLRVDRIRGRDDLNEVLKYTVKPQQAGEDGLGLASRVEVWRLLAGKRVRMLQPYGCYKGTPEPEEDEPFDTEDFRLFFFRWLGGEYVRQEYQKGAEART